MKELVQTSMEGFVWAPINPSVVKERLEFLYDSSIAESFPANIGITRKFTQVGNPASIVIEMKDGTTATADSGYLKVPNGTTNGLDIKLGKASLSITAGTVDMMRTNIAGFNVKPECYDRIYNLLKQPII